MIKAFLLIPVLFLLGAAAGGAKPPSAASPSYADLLAGSTASDWRALDPENTLYVELPAGRVIIELNPAFAPAHVQNIKALAREKYWDGLAIVRVQDNYVVQWADPNSENPAKKRKITGAKPTLAAEFQRRSGPDVTFTELPDKDTYAARTGFANGFAVAKDVKGQTLWPVHCYGAVGAGRDNSPDSGGGTELYAVIGHSPRHLDRNVTLVGRVVQGIELFSSLPRGTGKMGFFATPAQNITLKSVRLAADLPAKERTELETLRTDTPLFKKLIEARRNRVEEWFLYKAGKLEVCNMPVAVRAKASAP